MDGDQAGIRASAWADEIWAERGYRSRRRRLVACAERGPGAVAEALTQRAHARMRDDPRGAMQCGLLAARAAKRGHLLDAQIEALRAAGQAACVLGRFGAALRCIDTAVDLAYYRGDTGCLASLSLLKLDPLIHLERYQEARSVGQLLLHAMSTAGDGRGLIRTRMALADRHFRLDEPREALAEYRRVDALLTDDVGPRFRAVLAANRANALVMAHRFRAAERHFAIADRLLADSRREHPAAEHSRAQVAYNRAYGQSQRGRYDAALRGYAATAEVFERKRDERHLALIDLERAEIHLQLNLPDEAARLALRAEERFIDLGMWKERAQAALHAGQAFMLQNEFGKAQSAYIRAEAHFDTLGLSLRRAACRLQRARLAIEFGRLEDAKADVAMAEAISRRLASPSLPAAIDLLHAGLALQEHSPEAAVEALDRIEAAWNRVRAPWVRVEALHLRGRALATLGELDAAVEAYMRAIEETEAYRGGVPPDEYMTSFLAARASLYDEIVDLLVQVGDDKTAFEFTERAKSRALVDLLSEDHGEGRRPLVQAVADERIELLRRRLNFVYRRMFRSDVADPQRHAQVCRDAEKIEEQLQARLRAARPELAARPAAPVDVRAIQASLPADTTLLEYLGTDEALFTFVVTRDEIHVVRQEIPSADLRRHVDRFGFHIARFNRRDLDGDEFALHTTRVNLDALSDLLLEPVRAHLGTRRLLVVPHGDLYGLPFHALTWEDGWVADRFDVVHAPSAAVHHLCGRPRETAPGSACILGVPDKSAPAVEREAREAAAALGDARCYLGDDATLERLREDGRSAPLLHIASHGVFRPGHPMLSSIRLADRWVNLYDVYQLHLEADLVVLSACESGAARVSEGGEVLGLLRGFLVRGARALLASQWRVSDSVTAGFMRAFYSALADRGDPVAAHRAAMAATRARHPHPYYWAPFVLSGHPVPLRRRATTTSRVAPHPEPTLETTQ